MATFKIGIGSSYDRLMASMESQVPLEMPSQTPHEAQNSNLHTFRTLLHTSAEKVNLTDSLGNTALHYAVLREDDKFFKKLLKYPGIDVNSRNKANRTPLHWALDKCNEVAIEALIRHKDIQLDSDKDPEGRTCRQILIQKHPKLATKLLGLQPSKILNALISKQLDCFVKILYRRNDHVYYIYTNRDRPGTLLDIACRSPGNSKFVQILLERGSLINAINPYTGKAAIHEAILYSDSETVQILREDAQCLINILDHEGNSALHQAVVRNDVEIMKILINCNIFKNRSILSQIQMEMDKNDQTAPKSNQSIDINAINQLNQTPLHLALQEYKRETIEILLKQPNIDIDVQTDLQNRSCREIIIEMYPEFELELRQTLSTPIPIENLFSLLHRNDTEIFVERILLAKPSSTATNGRYTYLQFACKDGMIEAVQALLARGIDPNEYSSSEKRTPAMIAGYEGYHRILSMLLNHPQISFEPVEAKTMLHSVMHGMIQAQDAITQHTPNTSANRNRDHYRCLRYIIDLGLKTGQLDINFGDENGTTALHLAVSLDNYQVLKDLLDNGAYLGQKNNLGVEPVRVMNPATLQKYLNSCISSEGLLMRDNYRIIFNYRSLIPPVGSRASEIDTLFVMSNDQDLKLLLRHPLLTSYLDLKWRALKIYAYINLAFYAFFWLILNLYFYHYFIHHRKSDATPAESPIHSTLQSCVIISWSILVIRELYQYLVAPKLYIRSFMNLIEIFIIASNIGFLIFHPRMSLDNTKLVAAVAIICSSLELITLIGRLPTFASNLPMVTSVSRTCTIFMGWYAIFLIGMSFAFGILDTIGQQNSDIYLNQPATFLYNVSVMVTGRLYIESVTKDSSLKLYHFLFILVIILSAIISGIALAETAAVHLNKVLLGIIARIRSTYRTEHMANEDTFGVLRIMDKFAAFVTGCMTRDDTGRRHQRQMFYRLIRLADYIRPSYRIVIEPNRRNTVLIPSDSGSNQVSKDDSYFEKCSWVIDPAIVSGAANVLETNNAQNEVVSRSDFQRMERSIANLISILGTKS